MRYCRKCIIPDTRPDIVIGADGICSACVAHAEKTGAINWAKRQQDFAAVVDHAKRHSRGYDCIIPVSGGKDSTWQVVKCLEHGLNSLAVTWKTPARTAIGARNLANLVKLGVDHIDYQVNPRVEKRFLYQALVQYGSTAIPMHMAIFSIPITIAVRFEIPLVVWGENSAFEYAGSGDDRYGFRLDRRWLQKFGVTHGTTARDWVSADLTEKELTPYFGPSEEELAVKGVLAVFLGYYFAWDPDTSLKIARAHGFEVNAEGPRTGYYNYADIDDDFISIHHYLKWYKFGFTRLFDNLCLEIRNGRMTRAQAIEVVREHGDQTPHHDITRFCDLVEITVEHFWEVVERFRNPNIWVRSQGRWVIPDFLIADWRWS